MTTALATLNTNAAGDYWPTTAGYYSNSSTIGWPSYWPSTYCYHTSVSKDEGERAFKIAQALLEKKLVEPKSVKQFIDLVNTILTEMKRV